MALTDNVFYVNAGTGIVVTNIGSNATAAATATVTITNVTVPAGALIVVLASEVTAAAGGSMADGTNTYSSAASGAMSTAAGFGQIFFSANVTALSNATLTFTKNASTHAGAISAFYVAGIATSSAQDTAFTASSAVNSASPTVTSAAAPAANGELIIGACAYSNAAAKTLANPTGFLTPFANNANQSTASVGGGNYNAGGNNAITYAPTLTGASDNITFIVAFKPLTAAIGYWAKTSWVASTTKTCGNLIRPNVTAVDNERMFVCISSTGGTGTTGSSEPATLSSGATRGLKVVDNTVTWQECTGVAALNGDVTNTPTWAQAKATSTAVTLGQVCKSGDGTKILIVSTAGTVGGSEPAWSAFTTTGATTADNTATWTTIAAIPSGFANWATPHARYFNAIAVNWAQNGNKVFVGNTHNEVQTTSMTLNAGTTGTGFISGICVNSSGNVPPQSSDVTTGAILSTSGSAVINVVSAQYFYGITFLNSADKTSLQIMPNPCSNSSYIVYDNCILNMNSTNATSTFLPGTTDPISNYWDMRNTSLKTAGANTALIQYLGGGISWRNSSSVATLAAGSSNPAALIQADVGGSSVNAFFEGLDLSAFTGNTLAAAQTTGAVAAANILFKDCKLPSPATAGVLGSVTSGPQNFIHFVRCDSGGIEVRSERFAYSGSETTETTAVLTGGSTDGTTPNSRKIVTNVQTSSAYPYILMPIAVWNSTTGTSINVTMHGFSLTTTIPTNAQVWLTAEYLGTASSTQGMFTSGGPVTPLDTASNLTADTTANWSSLAAAYQTSHAYGAFAGGFIAAGNASPQQIWFISSHSGTGTSGTDPTIFNGKSDGAQVTDNAGGNQIVWQAAMRFSQTVTFTPQVAAPITCYWNFTLASMTYYIDPLIVVH